MAAAVLTGAATLFEARFGGLFASARFVRERPLAGDIGRLTGVLLLAWLIAARPRERTSIDGEDASADDDENDGAATAAESATIPVPRMPVSRMPVPWPPHGPASDV